MSHFNDVSIVLQLLRKIIFQDSLQQKIEKLKSQHEEACYLRDVNDKRGDNVAAFLEKYCSEEEFADFQYYVDMKSQLALMQSEIREKVKLGEERLKALEQTGNEWGFSGVIWFANIFEKEILLDNNMNICKYLSFNMLLMIAWWFFK